MTIVNVCIITINTDLTCIVAAADGRPSQGVQNSRHTETPSSCVMLFIGKQIHIQLYIV